MDLNLFWCTLGMDLRIIYKSCFGCDKTAFSFSTKSIFSSLPPFFFSHISSSQRFWQAGPLLQHNTKPLEKLVKFQYKQLPPAAVCTERFYSSFIQTLHVSGNLCDLLTRRTLGNYSHTLQKLPGHYTLLKWFPHSLLLVICLWPAATELPSVLPLPCFPEKQSH